MGPGFGSVRRGAHGQVAAKPYLEAAGALRRLSELTGAKPLHELMETEAGAVRLGEDFHAHATGVAKLGRPAPPGFPGQGLGYGLEDREPLERIA